MGWCIHWVVLISTLLAVWSSSPFVDCNDSAHFDEESEVVEMDERGSGLRCFVNGRCVDSFHVDGSLVSSDKTEKGYFSFFIFDYKIARPLFNYYQLDHE